MLKANPLVLADMRRLNLPPGAMVRAVVLPSLQRMDEDATLGHKPAYADAEAFTVCR